VIRGTGIDGKHDGLLINKLIAGFAHRRHSQANPWVEQFVSFVRQNPRSDS
jgi:cobyrinic acid a,c-diamide synthase